MSSERTVIKAIVLRAAESKEADCILTVLTAEQGKMTVIARGARRRGSRLTAACQLFAFSELVLYERHGWLLLSEASIAEQFLPLRKDLTLLSLASYFAELTESAAPEGSESGELLRLLLNALFALCELKKPPEQVRAVFALRLLCITGYAPLLDGCALCGAPEPEQPLFDAVQGVVLCRRCAAGGDGVPLDGAALAAMRHIAAAPMKRILSFSLDGVSLCRLNEACERFTAVQLDRRFPTLDFYRSIR